MPGLALTLSLTCAVALVALGDLRALAPEAIALLVIWGLGVLALCPERARMREIFLAALLVRAILLFSPPSLSDDLYRYLWEGHVALLGDNPYRYPPADPHWAPLLAAAPDPIQPLVNHPEVSSIYPPLAIWMFAGLGALAYDPLAIKAAMGLCDVLVAVGLAAILRGRRRSMAGAWLYALHPLAAVESAGSGHLEPAALLCMVLAIWAWDRGRPGWSWAALGALLKLAPGVLLLSLWRRATPLQMLLMLALGVATALPFLDAGLLLGRGLGTYAQHWAFNGALFSVLSGVLGDGAARPVALLLGAGVAAWALVRRSDPAEIMLWVGGALVLLSPTVHPWYIAWAWVPALICGVQAWSLLATLAPLSYVALISYDPATSTWEEPAWPAWIQYLPFLVALAGEWLVQLTRPGPWARGDLQPASPSPSPTPPGPSTPARPSRPSRTASTATPG